MPTENERASVREWLMKAPFDDPQALAAQPNFSYEDWFKEGRALPQGVELLTELLERETLKQPSGNGMRVAYAMGWVGDRQKRAIDALLRALGSNDVTLRIEAAAALGRLGDPGVLPVLKKLLTNEKEDVNVRANACIAIGQLGVPTSEKLLRDTLKDSNPSLVCSAEEALRLHGAGKPPSGK